MMILMLTMMISTVCYAESMTVAHTCTQQVGMRIAYLGSTAERVAQIVGRDMACSGHYAIDTQEYHAIPRKKHEITDLAQSSTLLLLMLESHGTTLSYRLYDTTTGDLMPHASGKCVVHNDHDARYAHQIADQMWRELMGTPSVFTTKIAYAKEMPYKKGIAIKHICVSDYDGGNEETMVGLSTIAIAPRWGGTQKNPLLFYSEFTKTNVQLMCVNQRKKRSSFLRYDGNSMYLTASPDGAVYAFSASRGDGRSHIYALKNGELMQCTFGDVTDACPTFNHDGSKLYCCSDEKTGSPHIIEYTFATKKYESLPIKGYCVTPAYNPKKNMIIYSKMVDGLMQLCVFDVVTHKEKQLTFDAAHHEDPSWSPHGDFIVYTHQVGGSSRIRMHCYATGHEQYVTPKGLNCSYSAWSLW